MSETTRWPANKTSRREFIRGAALGISALAMPSLLAAHDEATAEDRSEEALATADVDALHRRVRAELKVFTDWLAENGTQGYIGEVGWPDDARGAYTRWNTLAEAWFEDADAAGLWVTVWATGEWWKHPYYPLAVYENRLPGPGVDTANTQAPVVEAHPTMQSYLRGVCVAGAEFGTPGRWSRRVGSPTSDLASTTLLTTTIPKRPSPTSPGEASSSFASRFAGNAYNAPSAGN